MKYVWFFCCCCRYVGNLDHQMTEEFLITLFGQIGQIRGCKIIHEVISVGNRLVLMKYMSLF